MINESATNLDGRMPTDKIFVINSKTKFNSEAASPLYLINGKETGQAIGDFDPNLISSINILKEEEAIAKYGDKAKNGAVEITAKAASGKYIGRSNISTQMQLRKFIAKEIKYPKEVQENNRDGNVTFLFKVDKKGKIYDLMEKGGTDFITMDKIVVAAYKSDIPGKHIKEVE